jgi:hypothetical protein
MTGRGLTLRTPPSRLVQAPRPPVPAAPSLTCPGQGPHPPCGPLLQWLILCLAPTAWGRRGLYMLVDLAERQPTPTRARRPTFAGTGGVPGTGGAPGLGHGRRAQAWAPGSGMGAGLRHGRRNIRCPTLVALELLGDGPPPGWWGAGHGTGLGCRWAAGCQRSHALPLLAPPGPHFSRPPPVGPSHATAPYPPIQAPTQQLADSAPPLCPRPRAPHPAPAPAWPVLPARPRDAGRAGRAVRVEGGHGLGVAGQPPTCPPPTFKTAPSARHLSKPSPATRRQVPATTRSGVSDHFTTARGRSAQSRGRGLAYPGGLPWPRARCGHGPAHALPPGPRLGHLAPRRGPAHAHGVAPWRGP